MSLEELLRSPEEIEGRSFALIEEALSGVRGLFSPAEFEVVKRVVHATADPSLAGEMLFHPGALDLAAKLLRDGASIYCDTEMVRAGLRRDLMGRLGVEARTLVHEPEVAREARERGLTRAFVAASLALEMGFKVFLVGNSPTALLALVLSHREGRTSGDELVVGLPVGFVGAAESKEALVSSGMVYISNRGPRGGSPLASSVANALFLMALGDGPGQVRGEGI